MINAFVCDAIRTPFGRYGGSLSAVRADDLAAVPLQALMARNTQVDWGQADCKRYRDWRLKINQPSVLIEGMKGNG